MNHKVNIRSTTNNSSINQNDNYNNNSNNQATFKQQIRPCPLGA